MWFATILCLLTFAQTGEVRDDQLSIIAKGPFRVTAAGKQLIEDDVRIELPGLFLMTADSAVFDPDVGEVRAIGNVKIDYETTQGLVEITAQEVRYDLNAQSGELFDVTAQFGDNFYFVGDRLEILNAGENFIIERGTATACNQPTPQWSLKIRKATIEREGYAFIRHARFRVLNVPVIHLPYLILPAMQERRSGFLPPDTGRSERNGAFFAQPFYWAPRQDMDFTFTPSFYENAGLKLDVEARYALRPDLVGEMRGAWYRDDVLRDLASEAVPREDGEPLEDNRFRIRWRHDQDVHKGHFDIRVDAGSDFSVDRDFLRDTETTRVRDYAYAARYERSLGRNTLVVKANQRERILAQNEEVIGVAGLPELRFYQPNQHVGKGFFLRNFAYATHYRLDDLGPQRRYDGQLSRVGLESELSRAGDIGGIVHSRYGVGMQGAFYAQSDLDRVTDETTLEDDDIRGGPYLFVETVGPRLSRNYRFGGQRLVHYLDATLLTRYGFQDEQPFLDDVLLDELDVRINDQVDGARATWKLSSRFFAGEVGSVRPVLELELSQDVGITGDDDRVRPIDARFRLLNLGGVNASGLLEYNPDEKDLDTISIYANVAFGSWTGYGGYVRRRNDPVGPRESFIGITRLALPDLRSTLRASFDYDFELSDFKSQEFSYVYQGQCVAVAIRYVKSPFDSRRGGDEDFYQLNFSLTNLGDLGTKF